MLGQPQPEGETGGSRLLAETKKSYLGVSVGWGAGQEWVRQFKPG